MTVTMTDQSGNLWTLTFPPAAPRQTTWTIEGALGTNRYIVGETFIARDYFPQTYEIPAEERISE